MTNKKKARIKKVRAKTGVSHQGAINLLGKAPPQKDVRSVIFQPQGLIFVGLSAVEAQYITEAIELARVDEDFTLILNVQATCTDPSVRAYILYKEGATEEEMDAFRDAYDQAVMANTSLSSKAELAREIDPSWTVLAPLHWPVDVKGSLDPDFGV